MWYNRQYFSYFSHWQTLLSAAQLVDIFDVNVVKKFVEKQTEVCQPHTDVHFDDEQVVMWSDFRKRIGGV